MAKPSPAKMGSRLGRERSPQGGGQSRSTPRARAGTTRAAAMKGARELAGDEPALDPADERFDPIVKRVVKYLGGEKVLKSSPHSRSDVHDLIVSGMPGKAVVHVVGKARFLDREKVAAALGVSTRTIQRKSGGSDSLLSPEQSDKAWKFSELMVRASEVFGSQEEAEKWLDSPAIGLDRRRPIDLLGSSVGARLVEQLLGRLEYGIYT